MTFATSFRIVTPRIGFLLAMALLAGASCRQASAPARPPGPTASAPALPPDVSAALEADRKTASQAGDSEKTLAATGEIVSPVRSELVSKLPGRVGSIFVDQGAQVRKGQPLLELETDYFKLDAQRAEADLARAAAAADDAARDFDRKKELIGKGSVPQAVFDRSRSSFEQTRAARAAAAAGLALAQQRLADAQMLSPMDGVVLERRADVGERLGDNTVAFVLVQTAPLKLRFRVPERYLGAVHAGLAVRASVDPYPGQSFDGRISVVGQAVDPATRTLLVEAELPNRDGRLRSGLFARVELDLAPPARATR